jgi:hypothetical protein
VCINNGECTKTTERLNYFMIITCRKSVFSPTHFLDSVVVTADICF